MGIRKHTLFSCGAKINLMLIIIFKMIINYKNVDGHTFPLCYLLITQRKMQILERAKPPDVIF